MLTRLYPEKRFYLARRNDGQWAHTPSSKGPGLVTFPNHVAADVWIDFVARADGRKWHVEVLDLRRFAVLLARLVIAEGPRYFYHTTFVGGRWRKARLRSDRFLHHARRKLECRRISGPHRSLTPVAGLLSASSHLAETVDAS